MGTASRTTTSMHGLDDNVVNTAPKDKQTIDPRLPYFMNMLFPPWYLLTILSVWYYGFFTVFPYMYTTSSLLLAHRIFSTFILMEMMVNWACMCFVDSTFSRPPGRQHGPSRSKLGLGNFGREQLMEPAQQVVVNRNGEQKQRIAESPEMATKYYRTPDGSVIVSMPTSSAHVTEQQQQRTMYPYFSWKPCLICERMRPPRCHHCALCKKCVIKRDHHCYFAGACVGLYNQRHFIVFTFWASVATLYAFGHSVPFIYHEFLSQTTFWDLILPLTFLRLFFQFTSLKIAVLVTMEWSLVCFVFFSITFFVEQALLVKRSLTTFENENRVNLRDNRDFQGKVRAVFGEHCILQFLVPLHMWIDPEEDPINWPHIS